jgi:hypothetical protein
MSGITLNFMSFFITYSDYYLPHFLRV